MSDSAIFAAFFFPSLAAVLIFSMKYLTGILQAKVRLAQDEAYRDLAAKAATAQTETASALVSANATLVDVQSRLIVLEKILKQVE